jgi:hypothetical protein
LLLFHLVSWSFLVSWCMNSFVFSMAQRITTIGVF